MVDRFENFTYHILKIGKLIQRLKTLEVEEYGLKAVHVMCIYCLNKSINGLSSKELVEYTLEDKAAVSRALNLLKEKGLVDYEANKYNGLIHLTSSGKKIAQEINRKSLEALNKSGIELNDDERAFLYQTLDQILFNIEKYYDEKLLQRKNKKGA